jgi:hypothetical protein
MGMRTRPCAQAQDMPVVLHDGNGDNISGNEDNKVDKDYHTSCASAPGFKPSCASTQATASNIDATTNYKVKHRRSMLRRQQVDKDYLVRKRTRLFSHRAQGHVLSAIVCKRTSYSVCYGSA